MNNKEFKEVSKTVEEKLKDAIAGLEQLNKMQAEATAIASAATDISKDYLLEREDLCTKCEGLEKENEELKHGRDALREERDHQRDVIHELREENKDLRAELKEDGACPCEELQSQVEALEAMNSQLKKELEGQRKRCLELTTQCEKMTKQYEQAAKHAKVQAKNLDAMRDSVHSRDNKIMKLNYELAHVRDAFELLWNVCGLDGRVVEEDLTTAMDILFGRL